MGTEVKKKVEDRIGQTTRSKEHEESREEKSLGFAHSRVSTIWIAQLIEDPNYDEHPIVMKNELQNFISVVIACEIFVSFA